jgi:hypothetical protein
MEPKYTEKEYRDMCQKWQDELIKNQSLRIKLEDKSTGFNILAIALISALLVMWTPSSNDNYEDRPDCEPTAYHPC